MELKLTFPHLDQFNNYTPATFMTGSGTPYLKEAGVALVGMTSFRHEALRGFLDGFDADWDVEDYLGDRFDGDGRPVSEGADLAMTAGQLCYLSFGEKRTRRRDMKGYFDKTVREGGHGSIIEHTSYSFLLWGIDRAVTHELVRHRAGMAYSQVSQRYVSGKLLRFVERPEFQLNEVDHDAFCDRIDDARRGYDGLAERLKSVIPVGDLTATEARKAVNQAARAMLPNETEAPILATGNARAWRHIVHLRASKHADVTIRRAIFRVGRILMALEPTIFGDFEVDEANHTLTSEYH